MENTGRPVQLFYFPQNNYGRVYVQSQGKL